MKTKLTVELPVVAMMLGLMARKYAALGHGLDAEALEYVADAIEQMERERQRLMKRVGELEGKGKKGNK